MVELHVLYNVDYDGGGGCGWWLPLLVRGEGKVSIKKDKDKEGKDEAEDKDWLVPFTSS